MHKIIAEITDILIRLALIVVLLFLMFSQLQAQHFNFSQYNLTPLRVNPGLVGSDSEAMLIFHYRNQNTGAQQSYNSSMFTATMPLVGRGAGARRWGGFGISVLDDRTDGAVTFINQTISGNLAYNINFTQDIMLSFGLQGDFNSKRFSTEGIATGMQYRDWSYDPSSSTGEQFENFNAHNFAVSTGFFLYQKDLKNRNRHYTGLSIYNLNRPDQSLLEKANLMPVVGIITAGYRLFEKGPFDVTPQVLYSTHAGNNLINFGSVFSYDLDYDPAIAFSGRLDLAIRHTLGRTGIIALQFHKPNYMIGFSYDFPVTSSGKPAMQNAMEIVFSLKAPVERDSKVKNKKVKKKKEKKAKKKKTSKKKKSKHPTTVKEKETVKKVEKPVTEEIVNKLDVEIPEVKEPQIEEEQPAKGILKVHELLKDFEFDFAKSNIKESSKAYLDELAHLMKENPTIHVDIIGHTDDIGSEVANILISLKRAQNVKAYLVEKGVSAERIKTEGKGKTEPKFPNVNDHFRALNRRVEFLIYE